MGQCECNQSAIDTENEIKKDVTHENKENSQDNADALKENKKNIIDYQDNNNGQIELDKPVVFELNDENLMGSENNKYNGNVDLNNFKNDKNIEKENEEEQIKKTIDIPISNKENEIKIDDNLIPEDDFSKYIFEQINLIRKNPNNFIEIIEESKSKILEKNGKNFYKSKVKVVLNDGISVFNETIEFLKKTQPMSELQFSSKICVPLPKNEEEIKNPQYLKSKVEEIKKKYSIKTYWRDIINDSETSFILMIVDDNGNKKGLKRKEILNPEMKYIGINSITIEKSFVCYLTLSDKIK